MNRRKFRAEVIKYNKISNRDNAEFIRIRRKEYELSKRRHLLDREGFMLKRITVEGHTEDLKREMKGMYKHCIAEVDKENETLEDQIEKADAKILELENKLKS